MAHIQQQEFCRSVKDRFPDFFKNKFILDIGSLDINGNNQEYFENSNYIGVDIAYGRNVDIVSKGHELGFPDNTFDIIISTECFEHDQYYINTIQNIYRMLKPGGLLMFTCATTGRAEHGTRRTTPEDAPLLQCDIEWSDYYKNLTENDIREVLDIEESFSSFEFSMNEVSKDLYFYGFKKGSYLLRDDYSFVLSDKPRQFRSFIQLFLDHGNGISEENSIKLPVVQNTDIQEFTFYLSDKQTIETLRLDPLNEACVVEIEKLALIKTDGTEIELRNQLSSNAIIQHDKSYLFDTIDPICYFTSIDFKDAQKLIVHIRYAHIGRDALEMSNRHIKLKLEQTKNELEQTKGELEQTKNELEQTKGELEQTKNELEQTKASLSWRVTKPL